jgi:hypothetical protein
MHEPAFSNTSERMSTMTPLLINGLSVLMLLFFGAMALFPLLLADRAGDQSPDHEDRVLHISPAPMTERSARAARHQPVAIGSVASGTDPSRREAA